MAMESESNPRSGQGSRDGQMRVRGERRWQGFWDVSGEYIGDLLGSDGSWLR